MMPAAMETVADVDPAQSLISFVLEEGRAARQHAIKAPMSLH
jgi:hypothetical protein